MRGCEAGVEQRRPPDVRRWEARCVRPQPPGRRCGDGTTTREVPPAWACCLTWESPPVAGLFLVWVTLSWGHGMVCPSFRSRDTRHESSTGRHFRSSQCSGV